MEEIERRLARTLFAMAEGSGPEFAIVQDPEAAGYVQFAADEGVLHMEAVSNEYLPVDEQLRPEQIESLRGRGFSEPEPNHARDIPLEASEASRRSQAAEVSQEAVGILTHVYGISRDALEVQTDD